MPYDEYVPSEVPTQPSDLLTRVADHALVDHAGIPGVGAGGDWDDLSADHDAHDHTGVPGVGLSNPLAEDLIVGGEFVIQKADGPIDDDPFNFEIQGGTGAAGFRGGGLSVKGGTGNGGTSDPGYHVAQGGKDDGAGGDASSLGGSGLADKAGGSVILSGGSGDLGNDAGASITVGGGSGDGSGGLISLTGVPTADPNVVGALYTTAGALRVSAG